MGMLFIRLTQLLVPVCLLTASLSSIAQARDESALQEIPQDLQQPGDDVAQEAQPVRKIEEKTTKSLAWYMSGIAAQSENDFTGAIEAFSQAALADPEAPEPVRAQALLLLRSGQVAQGIALGRRAIQLDPGDFRTRFQLASILLRQPTERNVGEALDLMDAALQSDRIDPTHEEFLLIHSVRGRILLQLGEQNKAADSYEVLLQALERPEDFGLDFRRHRTLMEDRLTGYETVGNAMLSVGRIDDAIRAFEALVRVNQDEPGRAHLLLASGLFRADRLEEAEESLNACLDTGYRERDALKLLSQIYAATSRSSKLIPRITELLEDAGNTSEMHLFLAETQLQQGQIEAAVESYEKVILDTGDSAAYLGLVRVDILTANADSLIGTLQKALRARISMEELEPFRAEIIENLELAEKVITACDAAIEDESVNVFPEVAFFCAQIAEGIKNADAEARLLQATLSLNPNQQIGLDALDRLGMNYLLRDEYNGAVQAFRRVVSVPGLDHGRRVITLLRLSIAESLNNNDGGAIEAIQTAMDLQPNHPELTYRLGWIQYRADDMTAAEATLGTAIDLAGGDPGAANEARMLRAVIYSRTQRFDKCLKEYETVIRNSANDPDTHRRARMSLSAAYVEKGDNAEAENILEELYAEQPADPGVNNDLGYLYADQNKNLDQALEMIQLAVAAFPDNQAYLDSLGWVLHRLGRHEEALDALKKANSDPNFQDATLQEHLGDVHAALGQLDEARAAWKKALEIEQASDHPDDAVMTRLKERLGDDSADSEKTPENGS